MLHCRHLAAAGSAVLAMLLTACAGPPAQLGTEQISERLAAIRVDGERVTAHGNEIAPSSAEIDAARTEVTDPTCANSVTAMLSDQADRHEHFSHGELPDADVEVTSYADAEDAEGGMRTRRIYATDCASFQRAADGKVYASTTLEHLDTHVDGSAETLAFREVQADGFSLVYVYAREGSLIVAAYGTPPSPAPIDIDAYTKQLTSTAEQVLDGFE